MEEEKEGRVCNLLPFCSGPDPFVLISVARFHVNILMSGDYSFPVNGRDCCHAPTPIPTHTLQLSSFAHDPLLFFSEPHNRTYLTFYLSDELTPHPIVFVSIVSRRMSSFTYCLHRAAQLTV